MKDKIFLEQDAQETYNIIDALQFYRDNAVKPKFRPIIDKQIEKVIAQLEVQGINIYKNNHSPMFAFGESVTFDGKKGIVAQMSDEEGFVKIAIADGDILKIVDAPVVLISKEEQ